MGDGKLRVLLNASAVPSRPAGAGIYTLELAGALRRRNDVDVVVAGPFEGCEVASPARGPAVRSAWEQTALPAEMKRRGIDVYHGAHFSTPLFAGRPTVATVHDLTFYRLPRRYGALRRNYYRALARTAARADRIIVPSRAVAADVETYLGRGADRVRVVAEAPRCGLGAASPEAVEEIARRLCIEHPYLVVLGTAEPGKRAVDAVRAMALLRDGGVTAQLVLAGNAGPLSDALEREAQRLGVDDRVVFAGYIRDEDLSPLLTGAAALLFPSLYEGFGLPPLEAMACGTPVVASDAPAMNEVLGGAARLVPLRDPEALAASARGLLESPSAREEWAARGREHVAQFSWERAAAETVEVYREVAA